MSPAQAPDAPALAAIHAQAFAAPWSAEDIAGFLKRPEVFGLAAPEGFILMRTVAGEAEVLTLAVSPAARRKGHARALLAAGLDAARHRGADAAFLEVADDNAAAIALYRGAGFHEVGRRRGYYSRPGGPADALVMRRDL